MPTMPLILSKKEAALAEQIAQMHGITVQEAAERVMKAGIAHIVKKRTGKVPARVYPIKGKQ